jgi:hypothetical protein
MHEFWTATNGTGVTLLGVLIALIAGVWINQSGLNRLEARLDKLDAKLDRVINDMHAGFLSVRDEFIQVKVTQAIHEYRLAELEKNRA